MPAAPPKPYRAYNWYKILIATLVAYVYSTSQYYLMLMLRGPIHSSSIMDELPPIACITGGSGLVFNFVLIILGCTYLWSTKEVPFYTTTSRSK